MTPTTPDSPERYCYICKKEMPIVSLEGHSIGLLHAVCSQCGYCEDCDEGNV